ncbi:1-Cys peroxiredoxin [Thermoflavifilum aggregans]|uniref:Alkyl hydroperoxide reductase C n=1 Tax=Thermoflavifilum aggregans TaxID=454188 RepID=A0A2M9CSM5_9BACT|nr:peroxiredoxin [Thermoflavifilum aggregans]MBX6379934.1 peroxiredoxin [Thermoflavifilum aggregans]PJJ74889.1 1-Cys peroxiredoxin [Thermoflavifilum aggregans]
MSLRLGDTAPNFKAQTTQGEIDFYEYLGNSWGVFFSHPADFTPICTTELGRTAQLADEFAKRNAKIIAISVDPLDSHQKWVQDINEVGQTQVNYPIIADPDRKIATLYDMIHPNASETHTVRNVFIIDPDKKIRLILVYPPSIGRNFYEILRALDALQLTAQYPVSTPVDWKEGDDVVIAPSLPDEEARKRFPKGFRVVKPYLRFTPQPNK